MALRTAYFLQRRLPAVATCLPSREPVTLSTTAWELKPRASAPCFKASAAAETARVPFWIAACQRFHAAVRAHSWSDLAEGLTVTVTVGVAGGAKQGDPEQLMRRADAALYRGKRSGRDTP